MFTARAAIFFFTSTVIGIASYAEFREDRRISKITLDHWVAAMIVAVGAPTLLMVG